MKPYSFIQMTRLVNGGGQLPRSEMMADTFRCIYIRQYYGKKFRQEKATNIYVCYVYMPDYVSTWQVKRNNFSLGHYRHFSADRFMKEGW